MESHLLDVDGLAIAVTESAGRGPPIVLVHGNSASARAFRHQLDGPLGERHRLVAIDLPGHGRSRNADDPARTCCLPDAAGFLVFGTPPLAFPPDIDGAYFPSPAMQAVFTETLTDEQYDAWLRDSVTDPDGSVPAVFHEDARRTDGRARSHLATSIRPGGYLDEVERLANLKQPLAVLHGAQEKVVRFDYLRSLNMPTLWRDEVQVIAGAGHAPQWERAGHFDALVEAFAAECAG